MYGKARRDVYQPRVDCHSPCKFPRATFQLPVYQDPQGQLMDLPLVGQMMSVYSAWNQLLTLLLMRCQILVIYNGDQGVSFSIQRRSPTNYVENLRSKLQQCKARFTHCISHEPNQSQSIKFSQVHHLSQFRSNKGQSNLDQLSRFSCLAQPGIKWLWTGFDSDAVLHMSQIKFINKITQIHNFLQS